MYQVEKFVDGQWWKWGCYSTYDKAVEVATWLEQIDTDTPVRIIKVEA